MPSTNSNTPIKRVFTDEEIALLSGIFRLVLKEITSDADKSSIAPGEPAIDYNTGVLYVRNPHTGNLISPNGLERMQMIAEHFDINGILSSDLIRDLAVYTDLSELPEPIPATNPDTIISHMSHHPSAFIGPIESDTAGWPSKKGYFIVVKYDEETVLVRFFDLIGNTAYYGIYNQESHLLDGWTAYYSIGQFTESEDTDKIDVELEMNITDLGGFTVRLVNGLEPNSKVIVNGGPERSIVDLNGNPIDYPIAENNSIMLLYDGLNDVWVLNDSGESATMAGVHLLQRRVTSLNQSFIALDHSTTTRINELATNLTTEIHNVESDLSSRINDIDNRVSGAETDIANLETNKASKSEVDAKFNNFDAAWVKSINGSKLPMSVMPEGAIDRMYIVPSLAVLADRSAPGYPTEATTGDTLKDNSTGVMYYIVDEAKLGTDDYMAGISDYNAGTAAHVEWENVGSTPTTLAGYGITDAVALTTFQQLVNRVDSLTQQLGTAMETIARMASGPKMILYTMSAGQTSVGFDEITDFESTRDSVLVNYGQTLLRETLDYVLDDTSIRFTGITFSEGDVVQFIIVKR